MLVRALIPLLAVAGLALATPAHGYQHKTTDRGDPVRWPAGVVEVDASLGDHSMEQAAARGVVARVLARWALHLPPVLALELAPPQNQSMPSDYDRLNVVRWVVDAGDPDHEPEALATTMITYATGSGLILDADIVVNAVDNRWTIVDGDCDGGYDLENALSHEVGHFLGLGHEPDRRDATMYPSMRACDTDKRELSDDDIAGVQSLYAEIETAGGCSAGGLGAGLLLPALAIACLLRRRRLAIGLAALVTLGAIAHPAAATTVRRLSMAELTLASELVVRGRVISQTVVAANGRIYTDSVVAVDECWRGACPEQLSVRQLGGELEGVGLTVEGITPLRGDRPVVLFLRPRARHYRPVAMSQGVFRVQGQQLVRDLTGSDLIEGDGRRREGGLERVSPAALKAEVERVSRASSGP
jgi:hypothetical protein